MTNLDFLYEELKSRKKPAAFSVLANLLMKKKRIAKEDLGSIFADLCFDKRFVSFEGNKWDLAERYTLKQRMNRNEDLSLDDDEDEYEKNDEEIEEDFDDEDSGTQKDLSTVLDEYDTTVENEGYDD